MPSGGTATYLQSFDSSIEGDVCLKFGVVKLHELTTAGEQRVQFVLHLLVTTAGEIETRYK